MAISLAENIANLKHSIVPVTRSCYNAIHNELPATTGNLQPNNPQ